MRFYFKRVMFQVYDEPDLKVIVSTPLNEGETAAKIRQLLASSHDMRLSGVQGDAQARFWGELRHEVAYVAVTTR